MKNGLLIYNVILTLAVGYLYYRQSQCERNGSSETEVPMPVASGNNKIVFVNTDSLLVNYDYYNSLKDKLTHKQDSIDAMLKNRGRELEGEITNYQKIGGSMTEEQRGREEERLGRKQQQLVEYRQSIIDHLSKEEEQLQDSLHSHLVRYLREMNKGKNFQFILGYQKGSGILLANDSLDITKAVIAGVNRNKE